MAEIDLQEIHDLLVTVALEAGQMMLSAKPSHSSSGIKKNSVDLVTETDKAVEKHVTTRLLSSYPSFQFIGEETYYPGQKLTAAPTFIVDPIDGTTNFIHNFPAYCISLGFAIEKVPTVGVVYNPPLDELYTGIKGRGSYKIKGKVKEKLPLREPEPLRDLSSCLAAVEWGYDRTGANFELKSKVFTKLGASRENGGAMVRSLRCLGSAALNVISIATGQMDLFWDGGCRAWDVCAGWCILVEAGGVMFGGNPGEWECEIEGRRYLAIRGAPSGQKQIAEEMWGVMGEGRLKYES